jgi:hypothetical protein
MTPFAQRIAVKGGIGDFLQCVPFMLAYPKNRYLVASHNDCVLEFFGSLGIEVEEVSLGRLNGLDLCPRYQGFFRSNPFPPQPLIFTDDWPVIGVHLGGSNYSVNTEHRFGFPSKVLPLAVFNALVWAERQYNFLLFGSVDELTGFRVKETSRIKCVSNEEVSVNLSHVSECSAFIGSDSAFKTMSAMLGIPTIVWMGDYKDKFRDDNFIDPYVKAEVMSVYRYRDLSSEYAVSRGVNFSLKQLEVKKQGTICWSTPHA